MESLSLNKKYNKKEKKEIVIKNVIKMLCNRKLLDKTKIDSYYNNIIKNYSTLSYFEIKLLDNTILNVMLIDSKITSIKKIDNIDEILLNNKKKIFIVNSIQNKIWEILIQHNIEVFYYYEFLINIVDHDLVPEHILLVDSDKNDFLKLYKDQLSKIPFILQSDPITRYFNANVNDIFKIKRVSPTSGISYYYRIVKQSSLTDML